MAKKSKKKVEAEMPSPTSTANDDKWRAESDARTLRDASEILADPERLKRATKEHKKQKKAFRSVDDLIAHRNEMHLEPDGDE